MMVQVSRSVTLVNHFEKKLSKMTFGYEFEPCTSNISF